MAHNPEQMERLASGRRTVNLCMFSWLAAGAFQVTDPPLGFLFFLGSTVAAVVGTWLVAQGLGMAVPQRTFAILGAMVPLLGLLIMAWLGARATGALQSAGYQVGMFLSSKRHGA